MEEKYPTESRELLAETEEQVEEFGEDLIDELSAQNTTTHPEFDLDLPTMLNLHHYQQQGSHAFLIMLKLWLTGKLPEPEHRPFAW